MEMYYQSIIIDQEKNFYWAIIILTKMGITPNSAIIKGELGTFPTLGLQSQLALVSGNNKKRKTSF